MSDMGEIEQVAFDIISNAGEARSLLMQVIQEAQQGNFEHSQINQNTANERLKDAEKAHFKVISSEAKQNKIDFSLLLVHAEDQMMAAELLRDLVPNIVATNQELFKLKNSD